MAELAIADFVYGYFARRLERPVCVPSSPICELEEKDRRKEERVAEGELQNRNMRSPGQSSAHAGRDKFSVINLTIGPRGTTSARE